MAACWDNQLVIFEVSETKKEVLSSYQTNFFIIDAILCSDKLAIV